MPVSDDHIEWDEADRPLHGGVLFSGTVVETYHDGSAATEVDYKNGLRDGWTRYYYPGGQLEAERQYVHGAQNGISRTFYASGTLKSESVLCDSPRPNTLLSRRTWDEDGTETTGGRTWEAQ